MSLTGQTGWSVSWSNELTYTWQLNLCNNIMSALCVYWRNGENNDIFKNVTITALFLFSFFFLLEVICQSYTLCISQWSFFWLNKLHLLRIFINQMSLWLNSFHHRLIFFFFVNNDRKFWKLSISWTDQNVFVMSHNLM